jgi:hypothetical protein
LFSSKNPRRCSVWPPLPVDFHVLKPKPITTNMPMGSDWGLGQQVQKPQTESKHENSWN